MALITVGQQGVRLPVRFVAVPPSGPLFATNRGGGRAVGDSLRLSNASRAMKCVQASAALRCPIRAANTAKRRTGRIDPTRQWSRAVRCNFHICVLASVALVVAFVDGT